MPDAPSRAKVNDAHLAQRNLESSAGEMMSQFQSDWSLRRPRPLSVHYSSRDRELCRLNYLRSLGPKERVARHSELARDKTRQTGHGNKD